MRLILKLKTFIFHSIFQLFFMCIRDTQKQDILKNKTASKAKLQITALNPNKSWPAKGSNTNENLGIIASK